MFSIEHQQYLKRIKKRNRLILSTQIFIIFAFILIWELLTHFHIVNPFLVSSPSNVLRTIISLHQTNNLYRHIFTTVYETIISFSLATIIGVGMAIMLWWNNFLARVFDPYLTILNSLPKVALGPIIIIWVGANTNSIILMALLISTIITIINVYYGFVNFDINKIKLLKSFKASKVDIFLKAILPGNLSTLVNALKINVSMALIGVVMGELLVSRKGIGYLIMYGSQVFNLNLVVTGIILLGIVAYIMYWLVCYIEKRL
ncbi:MAG: ABC transporter permease [Bacilli bacterium]|jgi:NitT/TauT family transport system permease protein|nr:ABC transporter permease [Bacilli bacterium]